MSYMTYGTAISRRESVELAQVAEVAFTDDTLIIRLTDGRAIHLDLRQYSWLGWLLQARPAQRDCWEIVPSGGGVWWPELDNGVELQPLLDLQPLR